MKLEPNKKYKVIDNDLVNGYIILTGKEINRAIEDAYKELQLEKNKWLLQKLKETNLNYLFKNLGGYSMDSKTREKILHRCEILRYMGDDGISCIFDQLPDDELMEDCGWVLDKAHDDLDNFQLGLTRKIINDRAPKVDNSMWS